MATRDDQWFDDAMDAEMDEYEAHQALDAAYGFSPPLEGDAKDEADAALLAQFREADRVLRAE